MFQCFDVPFFQCFNVSMFQWSRVPMFQCLNVQMFKCSYIQMFKYSNVPIFQCHKMLIECCIFKCSNVQMSIRLNFFGAYLRSSSGHFYRGCNRWANIGQRPPISHSLTEIGGAKVSQKPYSFINCQMCFIVSSKFSGKLSLYSWESNTLFFYFVR